MRTTNPLQDNLQSVTDHPLQRALAEFEQSSQRECKVPQKQRLFSSFALDQSRSLVPTHMVEFVAIRSTSAQSLAQNCGPQAAIH